MDTFFGQGNDEGVSTLLLEGEQPDSSRHTDGTKEVSVLAQYSILTEGELSASPSIQHRVRV